jgi:hypothetical protein
MGELNRITAVYVRSTSAVQEFSVVDAVTALEYEKIIQIHMLITVFTSCPQEV